MKSLKRTDTDYDYLNDFHREWNERCMRTNEKMRSMHFSHAYAKAQSERMDALIRKQEEEQGRKRKNSSDSRR